MLEGVARGGGGDAVGTGDGGEGSDLYILLKTSTKRDRLEGWCSRFGGGGGGGDDEGLRLCVSKMAARERSVSAVLGLWDAVGEAPQVDGNVKDLLKVVLYLSADLGGGVHSAEGRGICFVGGLGAVFGEDVSVALWEVVGFGDVGRVCCDI